LEKIFIFIITSIIKNELKSLTSKDRVNVIIVDDSVYSRIRNKSVELLAILFNYVDCRYKKGFRMLTLGWSAEKKLFL
jgi:hypothetical protein